MAAGDITRGHGLGRQDLHRRIAWGTVQLDGSNPTPVDLSKEMTTIESAQVSLKQATAPGDDPSWLSCDVSGSTLNVYAWKNTGGTDPTLIASANNTAVVCYLAFGWQ